MKVIHNAATQPWSHQVTCVHCGSKIELEATDLAVATFVADQRDGDAVRFSCPVCAGQTWLAASLIPRALRMLYKLGCG